jgi:GH24 family phage-related lysozyme (muramidase)
MMSDPELAMIGGDRIRVFVSYDRETDGDLFDLLAEKASKQSCRFEITARSGGQSARESEAALRRAIRDADQVIVICGDHTQSSVTMATELRVAQEEERPYVLLWGRRERMCTKPLTAKSADAIYSWTWEILERQLLTVIRAAWSHEQLAELSRQRLARAAKPAPASATRSTHSQPAGIGRLGP